MGNTIRCCISCILPCGALDVVRIVHSNGRVEEISGTVRAADIMKAHPKHVLKKPTSRCSDAAATSPAAPRIVVVPPDAQLQRGKIYFLIPAAASSGKSRSGKPTKKRKKDVQRQPISPTTTSFATSTSRTTTDTKISSALTVDSDRYLSELLTEKVSTQRDRRRGRVAVWRPHLESITETTSAGENSGDL